MAVVSSVQGLFHDSGRAEMMGPVIVMEVVKDRKEEIGVEGQVNILLDSPETVGFCNNGVLRHLPSRSCVMDVDLKLRWRVAKA